MVLRDPADDDVGAVQVVVEDLFPQLSGPDARAGVAVEEHGVALGVVEERGEVVHLRAVPAAVAEEDPDHEFDPPGDERDPPRVRRRAGSSRPRHAHVTESSPWGAPGATVSGVTTGHRP